MHVKQQGHEQERVSDNSDYGVPKLVRRQDVPDYLRKNFGLLYKATTLAKFAMTGTGPPFHRAGRDAYYDRKGLNSWARSKLSAPTRSSSLTGRPGSHRQRLEASEADPANRRCADDQTDDSALHRTNSGAQSAATRVARVK
jgi:hypothetical protein